MILMYLAYGITDGHKIIENVLGCDVMQKHAIIIAVIVVIAIIAVVASFLSYPLLIAKDIQETIGVNFDNIDKVTIASGTTFKSSDITGKEDLQNFFSFLKGAKLTKSSDQQKYGGIIYSVKLYESGNDVGDFNFGYNKIDLSKDGKLTRYISSQNIDEKQLIEIAQRYKLNN